MHTWSQNKEITPDEYARLEKMRNIHPSDSQVLKKTAHIALCMSAPARYIKHLRTRILIPLDLRA